MQIVYAETQYINYKLVKSYCRMIDKTSLKDF